MDERAHVRAEQPANAWSRSGRGPPRRVTGQGEVTARP